MDIELLIERLKNIGTFSSYNKVRLWTYDSDVLENFLIQIKNKIGFTEKQALLAIKIIKKYKHHIKNDFLINLDDFLENPSYRFPIRNLVKKKTINIIRNENHPYPLIEVSFPYDENLINLIKKYRNECNLSKIPNHIKWCPENSSWLLELNENNISFLDKSFISKDFIVDEKFQNLSKTIRNIEENLDSYVPVLCFSNEKFYLKNTSPFVPALETEDLLEALFFCKKHGIIYWDDTIEEKVSKLNNCTLQILKHTGPKPLDLSSEKYTLESLKDLIKYSNRILFVIPGGNEYHCLSSLYEMLSNTGIKNNQMSVLFRTNNGSDVNKFIKEKFLNSPVSEDTKAVFISIKLPKPLIKEKVQFDSIIYFGINSVHYLLANYINSHYNSIKFNIPEKNANLHT